MKKNYLVTVLTFMCIIGGVITGFAMKAENIDESGYLRFPAVSGDKIVFTAEDDLFVVSINGGIARRLTRAVGREAFAHFSPDGKWITFSGFYDGNEDVYVVSADGGEPERLTFHPDSDQVVGWTPDGSGVLFRSRRDSQFNDNYVYSISMEGGFPERVPVGLCSMLSYFPDGKQVVFNRFSREFRHWKRYLGGWQQDIWYGNFETKEFKKLTEYKGTDAFPMVWTGRIITTDIRTMDDSKQQNLRWANKIIFLSDRDGTANLFMMDIDGTNKKQITSFTDFDVRWPSIYGDNVVFMLGADIWITNLSLKEHHKVPIRLPSDRLRTRNRFEDPKKYITDFELSPDGIRMLIGSRGEVFTVPLRDNRIVNLTNTPGIREKYPSYSPDGQWIACFSDASKEEELVIIPTNGKNKSRQVSSGEICWHFPPRWSPDGKLIAFADKTQALFIINVKSGLKEKVDQSEVWEFTDYIFSPDSRWLAYAKYEVGEMRSVFLYDIKAKKIFRITTQETDDFNPVFDPNGKYLYFLSRRTYNPLIGSLDFETVMDKMTKPYLVILMKGERSPLLPSTEEGIESLEELEWQKKFQKFSGEEKGKKEIKIVIDTDGLGDRIAEFPVHAGHYGALSATEDKIFYLSRNTEGLQEESPFPYEEKDNPYILYFFNLKIEKEPKVFVRNIDAYNISKDGQKLVYAKNGDFYIVDSGNSVNEDNPKNKVDLSKWVLSVDPKAEWEQIFYESWRLQRDFYWASNMAGSDWDMLKKKYEILLPRISTRDDLNDLIGEMIAELATSHTYIWGGDIAYPERIGIGLLGADLARDPKSGYWIVKHIYRGDPWDQTLSSPLLQTHIDVKEGDYILAVDGFPTNKESNIYSFFVNKADVQVQLTVNNKPALEKSRDVVIKSLSGDRSLRYRDWVNQNRLKVEKATDGKVGYIHLPNMGGRGLAEFNRQYYSQLDKQGLIVDVRNNGGGFVSQLILERLGRKLWAFDQPRHGTTSKYPYRVLYGHMVAICNQRCGSDGDIFSRMFQKMKLGPLVGMPTWGGVIGIRGDKNFMDKGLMTQPEFAWWEMEHGWNVENVGIIPDYIVDNLPLDIEEGNDPQLDKAVELIMDMLAKQPMEIPEPPPFPDKAKEHWIPKQD
ncbi:MAG: hypothetical protein A2161_03040 [Candidatus Schekmanbacteria bacterium RBG_13_48_7]|uniref:Tricorn protease homolog n=1 Tax=Candidatus Schekmanbacteria bacterium RBG_13_48_7 TaxID=1817878 RepID=A0A1F7RZG7_9BACT|nr:MAG: hypothetical protein A2161_03040 [Candidatus Schekmanbacteria bacterium RBG_13_48_7]